MNVDTALIKRVRAQRKNFDGRRKDELDQAIQYYETACHLSSYGNPERAAHWTGKARERHERLTRFLPYALENVPDGECQCAGV